MRNPINYKFLVERRSSFLVCLGPVGALAGLFARLVPVADAAFVAAVGTGVQQVRRAQSYLALAERPE